MIPSFGQLCFLLKTREVVAPPSPSEHFWGLRLIKSIFNALWRQRMSSWIQTPEQGWGWHPRSSRNFSPFFFSPYKSLYCRFLSFPLVFVTRPTSHPAVFPWNTAPCTVCTAFPAGFLMEHLPGDPRTCWGSPKRPAGAWGLPAQEIQI